MTSAFFKCISEYRRKDLASKVNTKLVFSALDASERILMAADIVSLQRRLKVTIATQAHTDECIDSIVKAPEWQIFELIY